APRGSDAQRARRCGSDCKLPPRATRAPLAPVRRCSSNSSVGGARSVLRKCQRFAKRMTEILAHFRRTPFVLFRITTARKCGVSAGVAVPSYAGVPVTYPGGGDTLTFVRGHEDEGKARASVDWSSLARLDGTIVCYAGAQQLPQILSALVAHGRPPEDAAAIV